MNRKHLLLLLIWVYISHCNVYYDKKGNVYLKPAKNANVTLPSSVIIEQTDGSRINLLETLLMLKTQVDLLTANSQSNNNTGTGYMCNWSGIKCSCYWDTSNSAFGEVSVTVGSNCTSGIYYGSILININTADIFLVNPCTAPEVVNKCDSFY